MALLTTIAEKGQSPKIFSIPDSDLKNYSEVQIEDLGTNRPTKSPTTCRSRMRRMCVFSLNSRIPVFDPLLSSCTTDDRVAPARLHHPFRWLLKSDDGLRFISSCA